MILRKLFWITAVVILHQSVAQNARSYDTNDWIPITPSTKDVEDANENTGNVKRATGRVLNLDVPNQKFFPDDDYIKKKPSSSVSDQYLRETSFVQKPPPRHNEPYKFEQVVPLEELTQNRRPNLVQPQLIQQQAVEPPRTEYVQFVQQEQQPHLSQDLIAPQIQSHQNYYETTDSNRQNTQYNILPFNNSFYQSLNPGAINQELLGAVQNQDLPPIGPTPIPSRQVADNGKETVQLLYVPLESLKHNQPITQQSQRHEKQVYNNHQHHLSNKGQHQFQDNIENDFIRQALAASKLQQQLDQGQLYLQSIPSTTTTTTTTTTTPRPKKRKPHQPPLAVFMEKQGPADINDVLQVLKASDSISVQDSIGPGSPPVFVGPSNLERHDGYSKFPLPYLSSIDGNRIERKVENLPFFVAPLSYKTPEGYSKIPLPSPHVGSVIVNSINNQQEESRLNGNIKQQNFGQFGEQQALPQQNPYFASPTPSGLGADNDYIPNYQGSVSQQPSFEPTTVRNFLQNSYTQTLKPQLTSKDFIPSYQLDSKQNDHFYPTTPSYQQQGKSTKSAIKTQQTNEQDTITKPYFPQQYDELPQKETNAFRYNEEPIKSSSPPTSILNEQRYQLPVQSQQQQFYQPQIYQQEQAIRQTQEPQEYTQQQQPQQQQFQLQQIDNQYYKDSSDSNLGSTRSTTTSPVDLYEITTTHRTRQKPRQRGRPTTTTTTPRTTTSTARSTTTTPNSFENSDDHYTILEEFEIKPKPKPQSTTQVETIPANVYKLVSEEPRLEPQQEPHLIEQVYYQREQQQPEQHVLNQDMLDQQILQLRPETSLPRVENHGRFREEQVSHRPLLRHEEEHHQGSLIRRPQQEDSLSSRRPQQEDSLIRRPQQEDFPIRRPQQEDSLIRRPQQEDHDQDQYILRQQEQTEDPHSSPIVFNNRGHSNEEKEYTEINPFLPGLINNLQDQAVKPLLNPNLLVPTTEKHLTASPPRYHSTEEDVTTVVETTKLYQMPTEAPTTATTTKKTRGRQRGNRFTTTTTASTPRRNSNVRRRPSVRTTTERQNARTTDDNNNYSSSESTRRPSAPRQRFRTRGRPVANERVSESSPDINSYVNINNKHPGRNHDSSSPEPQSYMQFEHTIANQQEITIRPHIVDSGEDSRAIKDYHQIYSLQTEKITEPLNPNKPVVDVQITHAREPEIITSKPYHQSQDENTHQYVRVNANFQSGGVLNNRKEEEPTPKTPPRVRGRPRIRITKPTTIRNKVVTTTTPKANEDESDEYYGFIKQPNFPKSAPALTTKQPIQVYSSSYQENPSSRRPQEVDDERSTTVHFVGEIRPKYQKQHTTEEASTEAQKNRVRTRARIPAKRPTPHSAEETNERPRTRTRGKSHFKLPETLDKKSSDDEDVEGGNYPASYLKRESSTKPSFQITIDPYEEDQETHSSIFRPKWVEASVLPPLNDLQIEDKTMVVDSNSQSSELVMSTTTTESPETFATTIQEIDELATKVATTSVTSTTEEQKPEEDEETTRRNNRRRGVWKLIKHRPVDHFEVAESQNYQSVLNSFDAIMKKSQSEDTTTTTTTENGNIFDTLYNMFGMNSNEKNTDDAAEVGTENFDPETVEGTTLVSEEAPTTTSASPSFPEEYTTTTTEATTTRATEKIVVTTTQIPQNKTTEVPVQKFDVEPWEMRAVKTSTSTEVSLETEICYKGRCVKSKKKNI